MYFLPRRPCTTRTLSSSRGCSGERRTAHLRERKRVRITHRNHHDHHAFLSVKAVQV
ncbi:hypothetical protein T484DRAFT_1971710 [Baffinella frigidus]|nr:hypothetical protein T484DRAFT_1971710 [Cryptophyta sp. CCMP2293]